MEAAKSKGALAGISAAHQFSGRGRIRSSGRSADSAEKV